MGVNNYKYALITEESKINTTFNKMNINISILPSFLKNIWKSPKSVATILSKADKNDIKENLAHFITHNFYENIFSSNGKEDQLIYIISLLLKEEINNLNLNDINASTTSFLKETACQCILKELIYKKEIQFFFKNILIDILKSIDSTSYPMIFNVDKIYRNLSKKINIDSGYKHQEK